MSEMSRFLSNIPKRYAVAARRAAEISGLRVVVLEDAKDRFGYFLPTYVALVSQEFPQRDLDAFWDAYEELVGKIKKAEQLEAMK